MTAIAADLVSDRDGEAPIAVGGPDARLAEDAVAFRTPD